jgi:phosphatidylglycerophosphate synthase
MTTTSTRELSRPPCATTAIRVHTSVLAVAEKRLLLWIARRLPPWVTSDGLTALALAGMIGAGLSFWLARVSSAGVYLVVVCLFVNWFGDSLDGTVARVRAQQRPRYGFYVDHVVDALGTAALFAGLGLSGYMSPIVAAVTTAAYMMLIAEVFLAARAVGTFTLSYFRIGPTELRLILAIGALMLLVHPTASILGRQYQLFDVGGVVATIGLFGTFLVSAAANTRTLHRAEPLPARNQVA